MRIADVIARDAAEIWASLKTVALGSTASKAAPGNHTHDLSALGALMQSQNLADLDDASAARENLGLGSAAQENAETFATAAQGDLADTAVQPTRTVNGHALSADVIVTAEDVGLGNCDNTSDEDKPVSAATGVAIATESAARSAGDVAIEDQMEADRVASMFTPTGPGDVSTGAAALAIASAGTASIGLSNFSGQVCVQRDTWATGAACTLLDATEGGNTGWRLSLTAGGYVRLQIGNGTNLTTYDYTSTAPISVEDGATVVIQWSIFRLMHVVFVVNGTQLGGLVECQDGNHNVNIPALDLIGLSDGTTHYAGTICDYVRVWLGYCASSDLTARYKNPSLWTGAAAETCYRTFESTLPAGMAGYNCTVTSNQDSIDGEDDCAKVDLVGAAAGTHLFYMSGASSGMTYNPVTPSIHAVIRAMIYFPAGNAVAMRAVAKIDGNGTDLVGNSYFSNDGKWQIIEAEVAANNIGVLGTYAIYIAFADANNSLAWTPPADGQQIAYVKNLEVSYGDIIVNFNTNA
jgi:hypothetical protein